jgi:hypothetical protein
VLQIQLAGVGTVKQEQQFRQQLGEPRSDCSACDFNDSTSVIVVATMVLRRCLSCHGVVTWQLS